jgi:predicted PurR-regulated permease PerM
VNGRPDNRTIFRWSVVAGLGLGLGLLAVSLGVVAVYPGRSVRVLGIGALFAAVSLDPAVRWLVRHRVPRSWAVGTIFVFALLATAGLVWAVVPPLVREATEHPTTFPAISTSWPSSRAHYANSANGTASRRACRSWPRIFPARSGPMCWASCRPCSEPSSAP